MAYICTKCDYKGQRKKVKSGSNLVSVMLWTILPTIYGIWELQSGGGIQAITDPMAAMQAMQSGGGSFFSSMDIALMAPGPIYSIWRRVKKSYACPQCGEKVMMRDPLAKDYDFSDGKDHVIEIEKKLAEMERKLVENKGHAAVGEVHKVSSEVSVVPAKPSPLHPISAPVQVNAVSTQKPADLIKTVENTPENGQNIPSVRRNDDGSVNEW